jgi:beta-alanine degradation protein BauB
MGRKLGDVATKLLFENERVRIWEMRLGAGEESAVHRHDLDYVLVQIEGDRMAVVPEPDSGGAYRDYLEADVFPGNAIFIGRGGIEKAKNVGKRAYREILVELKDERRG